MNCPKTKSSPEEYVNSRPGLAYANARLKRGRSSRWAILPLVSCVSALVLPSVNGAAYTLLNSPDTFTWNAAPWTAGIPNGVDSATSSRSALLQGGGTLIIDEFSTETTPGSLMVGWLGNSTLNITGGTLTVGDANFEGFAVGESGVGTVNQTGGVVNAAAVRIGRADDSTGRYNLNGGTLNAAFVVRGGGTATFNFNGGTIRPTATNADWFAGNITSVVGSGGAIFDTLGFDVTINSALGDDGTNSNGGLRKLGSPTTTTGVLRLGAVNTYTGDTHIDQGYLVTNVSNALPSTTVVRFNNVGGAVSRMDLSNTSQKIRGLASVVPTATLDIYSAAGAALEVDTPSGQSYSYYGNIAGTTMTFTKSGAGTQVLAGSNTYTGLTSINAGRLQIGDNDASAAVGNGNYAIAEGAQLVFSRNSDNVAFANQGISGAGDLIFAGQSTGYFTFRNNYTAALTNTGRTIVNYGSEGSPTWFQKALWLEKDNVLSNATVLDLQSGKVILRSQIGSGITMRGLEGVAGTFLTTDQATVQKVTINVPSGTHTFGGVIGRDTMAGSPTTENLSLTKSGPGTQVFTGGNTFTGGTTINGGTLEVSGTGWVPNAITNNTNLVYSRSVPTVLNGAAGNVQISGPGGVTFSTSAPDAYYSIQGGQSYAGPTTINQAGPNFLGQALFVEGVDDALPTGTKVNIVAGNVYQRSANQTIAGLSGGGSWNGDLAGSHTLTLNVADNSTYSGQLGEANGGTLNVVKVGAGTQTLAGASNYTGTTTVSAGRLDLGGSLMSNVAVSAGASLGGEGSTTGSITFNGANTLYFDPSTSDSLTAATINASGATVTLSLTAGAPSMTGIVVLNAPGGITGTAGGAGNFQFTGRGATYLNATNTQLLFDYAPGTVTWKGNDVTNPTAWDVNATTNWVNGATPDKFFANDSVVFDDLATTFTVNVQGPSIAVGSMTFNNPTKDYTLQGGSITGFGSLVKNGEAKLTVTNANTFTGGATINGGTVQLGDGTNGSGSLGTGQILNNGTLVASFGGNDAALGNAISGTGTLQKNGTGSLTLSGDNTYTGNTSVQTGTLILAGGDAVADSGVITVAEGAGLQLNASETIGSLESAGGVTLGGNQLTVGTASSTSISGAIVGVGGQLTKQGTGTLTLSGTNTYTGATTVSNGTLTVAGGVAISDAGPVAVAAGASFQLSASETIGALSGGGSVNVNSHTLTAGGTSNTSFSGVISGSGGALAKQGTGTLTLSGANTYTGATAVNGGRLTLAGGAAVPDASDVTVSTGANLQLANGERIGSLGGGGSVDLGGNALTVGNANNTLLAGVISGVNGSLVKVGTGALTLAGANTYTGPTNVPEGTLQIGNNDNVANVGASSFQVAAGAQLVFSRNVVNGVAFTSQSISGAGDVVFRGQSTGYFTFRPAPTYTGNLTYTGRTIVDYDDAVVGTQWFQRTLWLEKDNVFSHDSVLELQRGKVFLRAQTGAGITMAGLDGAAGTFITTDQVALQKLNIDVPSGSHSYDGVIGVDMFPGSPGNGNITLTKSGPGTQILNGENPFVGATTIAGGTLLINGSLSGASSVSVLAGATLGGNGAVGAITVADGGSIAPGMSVGSFTTGGLTFSELSILSFDLSTPGVVGGAANDFLSVNGPLTLNGTLDVNALPGFGAGNYLLMEYAGLLTDQTLNLDPAFAAAFPGSYIDTVTPGEVNLVVVPEPGSAVLLLTGLGLFSARRRRSK